MKSKNLFVIVMLSIAQAANAYDITDAIEATLINNTQLKENKINLQSANLQRFSAATEFLPFIAIQSNTSSQATNGALIQNGVPRSDQLQISQQIFSGGKGIYDLKSTKYGADAAAVQYQNNVDGMIIQTVQAYEYVIASRQAYIVAQQKVDSLKKIEKQSEIKLSVGTITKTNLLEAKARLATAISEKESIYATMKDSEENFRYVTGDAPPAIMDEMEINTLVLPNNFDLFLEQVEQNNQGIVAAEKNLESKQFATKSAKTKLLPTVSASVSFGRQQQWQQSFFSRPKLQESNGETYQLSVNIPIFQSGQEYVQIKQAQLAEDSAEVNKENTIMKTHKDAAAAWNKYNQTKVSFQSDKDSVEYYKEFVRGADEEFQIGTKTLTDLLEAQVRYEDSRIRLIQDKAAIIVSGLNMRFLMGDLSKVNFSKLVVKTQNPQKNSNLAKQDSDLSGKKIEKISEIST